MLLKIKLCFIEKTYKLHYTFNVLKTSYTTLHNYKNFCCYWSKSSMIPSARFIIWIIVIVNFTLDFSGDFEKWRRTDGRYEIMIAINHDFEWAEWINYLIS